MIVIAAIAGLGAAVVDLAGLALEAGARHGVDDRRARLAAFLRLVAPVHRGVVHRVEGAVHVHLHDRVEVFGRHREHHLVAEDAGVVHEHVEAAERVERGADDVLGAVEVGDAVVVGDGLAAALGDDVDDLVGGPLVGALAGHRPAEIVDDDLGAVVGELHRLAAADTVARSGDDRHLAVEHAHLRVPPR